MSTRPLAQILTASTAGTDASVPLNRLMAKGREAVEAGVQDGIAYFEWSADPEDDIESPLVWARCMPALGHTISESVVRHAMSTMTRSEFMRAFLNIPTATVYDRVWSAETWAAVVDPSAAPSGPLVFGVDATPDLSACSVAVAGGGVVELVEHRPGSQWLSARVVELVASHGGVVALDPTGPAGWLLPDLERASVEVFKVGAGEMGRACGGLHSAVVEGLVRVRRHPDVDAAVSAARTSPKGDVWVWARRDTSADISPLVAVTLAWWASQQGGAEPPRVFAF